MLDLHTALRRRYQTIRIALLSPQYLATHSIWTEQDFDQMIDEIVRLQEIRDQYEELSKRQLVGEEEGW